MIINSRLTKNSAPKVTTWSQHYIQLFFTTNFNLKIEQYQSLDSIKVYTDEVSIDPDCYEFQIHWIDNREGEFQSDSPYPFMIGIEYNGKIYTEVPDKIFQYFVFLLSKFEYLQVQSLEDFVKISEICYDQIRQKLRPSNEDPPGSNMFRL